MTPEEKMDRIDDLLSHVWVVRAFIKHSEEAEEEEALLEVQRVLYDYMLALGSALKARDAASYLKQATKKYPRLLAAVAQFRQLQPEISTHTNFQMARQSLEVAVGEVGQMVEAP